jgi:hypothetical protein|eukprot:COSAG06_NODE_10458_length_1679_cov_1.120253_2_plen_92_part_00
MAADEVTRGAHAATGTDRGGFAAVTAACFSQANDLQRTALAKLLTTERIFPKVVDIMGTNTTCYHFHCNVTVLELRAQQQQKRKKTPRAYR